MLSDSDIKEESFIEDVNSILNTGEVPNLFPEDEKEDIIYEISKLISKSVKNPFEAFLNKCKTNLHMMLMMSPAGDALRLNIRNYPALVNCTSIDWFMPWPREALVTVGKHFLGNDQSESKSIEFDEEKLMSIVEVCVKSHESVRELAAEYQEKERKHVYITPTAFIELCQIFTKIISRKHS